MFNTNHWRIRDLLKIPVRLGVVRVSSAIAIFMGSIVLIGWYFDLEILKQGFPGSPATMKANTALCLLLSGLSLWLSQIKAVQRPNLEQTRLVLYFRLSRFCAVTVAGIGLLTIIQYLFGWNFGIDELLFRDSTIVLTTFSPGRMGINTALSFTLIGSALSLIIQPRKQRNYWFAQIFTIIAALISLQSLLGYAYKEDLLYRLVLHTSSMALHTALTLMVLSIGILIASSKQGLMQIITNDSYGALIARRLLFPAIIISFVVGWLILNGERAKLYDVGFAISLFAIVLIIIFSVLVWQNAMLIDSLSRQNYRAQKALKINQQKLQSFVNANIIGILFGDIFGGIHEVNDEFLRIIGYTQEDLLAGKLDWQNLTPPEFLYLDEQAIAQAQSSLDGACVPYQKEYIRKDGSRVPVLIGFVLLEAEREKSIAFILDLSARQAALTELQKSKKKILKLNQKLQRRVTELQTLLDIIPIGIGIAKDPECQTINMNPTFAKLLKMQPHENASLTTSLEARPTTFKIFHQGKELTEKELPMQYAAAYGVEILDCEVDVVHDDGTVVTLLESVVPLFDENGQTRGCIGAFLDITERKQSEKLLRNHQQWLEDVLNWMPIPIAFIEPGTARVTFANQAADKLAGGEFPKNKPAAEYHTVYHCTDASGNLIPNEQMPGVRVARGECLAGVELDWHTSEGIHSLLIFADTLPAIHGYPATCIITFQDVTKLKQIVIDRTNLITSLQTQTEQLREANRMKDEFLAILSHELRSPLNAIVGWSHLLRTRKFSEDKIAQGLETIERNAKMQNQLIDDLLDISRIIRGKLKFNPQNCDLVTIIKLAMETVSLAAQAKEINLHFYPYSEQSWESGEGTSPFWLSASSVIVSGDSDRLQQIIWNLLTNAIKFTPQGGNVEIRLNKIAIGNPVVKSDHHQLRRYAQIQVVDNGLGITADFLPYVFDRFRQADSSNTRNYGGLGLGLSLVRHLTELHGGTVHVESLGEHQGSTFTVTLPLLEEIKNTEAQKPREEAETSPSIFLNSLTSLPILEDVKVLVVDDEADSREFISTVLKECQAQVIVVSSAQEALQMLKQWTPDVLISDIGMPEENGYSLIRKVRSLSPEKGGNIPAAALTAYAGVEDRMQAIQAGFQLHLPKPIEPAELAIVVASLVNRNCLIA
jgi:PAS domain S-box-containing protein